MNKTSRINRQQQIQVLIRLKPQLSQHRYQKCAYVSQQQQNALVVETPTKKQYFVFDSVANQHITQLQLYHSIGRQAVTQTLQGFNCCIFAYGQTGSGKTYSILGAIQDIMTDIYTDSRGILPRLLQDLMRQVKQNTDKAIILCSYMEIYNQQIFDLLNQNMRSLSIRQGKKGVYVQNLLQQNVLSYEDAISLVIKGQKNRKIASTSMNSQSSRSHTIFTIYLQTEINSQQKSMTRRSKIHIVDLAGSERVKHTNVQGQRLKQGCNINKSLHVLGSVINALVESTKSKKQKHVPFRDSKLTHFLKDSLAGNSITKLLATIQSNKLYYGDTLSTLMFAKRAKIIRVKVQANQNATDNYDSLRKQVKRLREQLAQTKYLAEGRFSQRFKTQNDTENYNDKIDTQNLQYSTTDKPIHIFQQNQLNYKALIQIYEQHMNECLNYNDQNDVNKNNVFKKKNNNIINHSQWKKLEKKNKILTDLLRKMPAFTRIFRQNQLLKQQRSKYEQNIRIEQQNNANKLRNQLSLDTTAGNTQLIKQMHSTTIQLSDISLSDNSILQQSMITSPYQQQLIRMAKQKTAELYQQLIDEIKQQFSLYIDQLDKSYSELQKQIQQKDKKIKEIFKRNQQKRPQIKQLNDQNQYLKLNILELEEEIAELQKELEHTKIQKKQLKRRNTIQHDQINHKNSQKYQDNMNLSASSHKFIQNINNIQEQNQNQHQNIDNKNNSNINLQKQNQFNKQQNHNLENISNIFIDESIIQHLYKIRQDTMKQMQLYQKQRQQMIQCIQILQKQCKRLDIENKSQLLTIQTLKISKNTLINKLNKISKQNNLQLLINEQYILQSEQILSFDTLWKQVNSQKMTFEQLQAYKKQTKKQFQSMNIKIKQMDKIMNQLNQFVIKQKAVQKQFGKSIDKILDEYAQIMGKNCLSNNKIDDQ